MAEDNRLEIRKAEEKDITDLLTLWQGQHDYHLALDSEYYTTTDNHLLKLAKDYFKKAVKINKPNIMLGILDGKTAGFISFDVREPSSGIETFGSKMSRHGEVIDLYFIPEARGKGIGKRLMDEVEKQFKKQGLDYMMVEVAAANTLAVEFYKKGRFVTRQLLAYKHI